MMWWLSRRAFRLLLGLGICFFALAASQLLFQIVMSLSHRTMPQVSEFSAYLAADQKVEQDHQGLYKEDITQQAKIHTTEKAHTDNNTKVWQQLLERSQRAQLFCGNRTLDKTEVVQGVFHNKNRRLAYCFVPKTGCTFWKQLFVFLKNRTGLRTPVHSPFDIPRLHVHLYGKPNGDRWVNVRNSVQDHLRFIFSRDPYSRLWSAYLDKLYLPDFWILLGGQILRKRNPRPSNWTLQCGANVTFEEFVMYTLRINEPHWTPVSTSCSPCIFKPQVIGKMETYSRDAKAILDHVGLGWILEGMDYQQHVRNEMKMLINYNFQVIHKKTPILVKKNCINDVELGARLWKTFQYNGYISESLPYKVLSPFNIRLFTSLSMRAMEISALEHKDQLKKQKSSAMEAAFKQLPKEVIELLAQRYALDFKMFDYKPRIFKGA